jgi:hypothetical protein
MSAPSTPDPVTPEITLPKWLFDEKQLGQKWMLAIEPNGKTHTDGGHSSKMDVAKAKALFEAIGIIRPPEGTRYVMLTIEAVPEGKPRLNKSAITTLNSLPR